MFDQLSDKLVGALKTLRGQSRVTEQNIDDTLKTIRLHLLEADVHFKVVKQFLDEVKAKAIGQKIIGDLNAGQQFVKIVHDELVRVLGNETSQINLDGSPSVLMLVGLQGAGKTTTSAKLALHIRKTFKKKAGLVSVDVYRPAAIQQLKTLSAQNDFAFFEATPQDKPADIAARAMKWAKENLVDVLILDTAGRLQIDTELMDELANLKSITKPNEILLVADAMLGQQSVAVAQGFNEKLGLTGLILSKADGDARGGAALSIRQTTGVPIKFLGMGEKVASLEAFHPDRLASRILDMGDVLSLVEKAAEHIDAKEAMASARKMAKNQFTVEDFLKQMQMVKNLGGLESMLKFLPGAGQMMKGIKDMSLPEKELKKVEAIIRSMTSQERNDHKILNGKRRLRIAKGSGTQVSDVNKFVNQFEQTSKMMSQMMKMGMGKGKGGFPGGKLPF